VIRVALIATLVAGQAAAAINPCVLDEMVARAETVVQIDDLQLGFAPFARDCPVSGTVRAVIRGEAEVGQRISVRVPCRNPDGRVGGDVYTAPKALRAAKAAELHLTGRGTIAGYGEGFVILDRVTGSQVRQPYCPD